MADREWLDDLSRSLSQGASRRGALRGAVAALIAGISATFSPPEAPTKRNKPKRKHRKRKKNPGGKQTGSCATDQTAGGFVLLVEVADTFQGKPLTLEHQTTLPPAGDPTARTLIELGQQLVLQLDADKPQDAEFRLHVNYGAGFSGVQESVFIILEGGNSIGGSIDGRQLMPRSVEDVTQDPDDWEFADGGPPPALTTDPQLLTAIQSVLARARAEAAHCTGGQLRAAATMDHGRQGLLGLIDPADWLSGSASAKTKKKTRRGRSKKRAGGVRAEDINVCDEVSDSCLSCWAACFATMSLCCLNPFACGGCVAVYDTVCIPGCDGSSACCPVSCGSDKPSSCCCEGETCCGGKCCDKGATCCQRTTCCDQDEACWPGGVCCKKGRDFCAGECCPQDTFCKEGICCRENAEPCFGECCPAGETCREAGLCCPPEVVACAGKCCPSAEADCQGDVCCPFGQVVCNGECCPAESICQPKDGAREERVCCPPDLVCGQVCCDELSRCIDPAHSTCCGFALEVCDGICCTDSGDVCVGSRCCPGARACGETCCPPGHFCASPGAEPGAADCRPCDEWQIPCPISVDGAPDCCPQNTQCCGDGTCCVQGVPCCDKGSGPKCDPTCQS